MRGRKATERTSLSADSLLINRVHTRQWRGSVKVYAGDRRSLVTQERGKPKYHKGGSCHVQWCILRREACCSRE